MTIIKETTDENGDLHSYNDEPAIEYSDGEKHWYCHGNTHREDGPAVIYSDGNKFWYHHGEVHREDGPAIECSDGIKLWWILGEEYTLHDWLKLTSLPEDQKLELLLSHDYN